MPDSKSQFATLRSRIPIDRDRIAAFCRKWKIKELSLFGSVLRDDFRRDSDIDVLIELLPQHGWSLYDTVDMEQDLQAIFDRPVDLVFKGALKNPIRREEILGTRQVIHAA